MIEEKVQAIGKTIMASYPEPLTMTAEVMDDRVTFNGEVRTPESDYDVSGFLLWDELFGLDVTKAAVLVLMRSMTGEP